MIFREITNVRQPSKKGKGNYTRKTRSLEIQCDVCGALFVKKWSTFLLKKDFHFCSSKCVNKSQQKGGILSEKKEKFFLEKYGFVSPLCNLTGSFRVHGGYPAGKPRGQMPFSVREKIMATNIERYGTPHPMQNSKVREKSKETCIRKYGVSCNAMRPEIQKKLHSSDTVEKMKKTLRKKDHSKMKEKMKSTVVKKYGVEHISQLKQVKEKRFATLKKNKTIKVSKKELKFGKFLLKNFENVASQVYFEGFSIDFFIKDIETYVQFDGVYWHGLDRALSDIINSEKKIDKIIYSKWKKDRELDELCKERGIILVRITDIDFDTKSKKEILKMIKEKNGKQADTGVSS